MEEKRLLDTVHSKTYYFNVKVVRSVKDFFKESIQTDISNLNLDKLQEKKEVLEWIIENPNYNFNENLYDTGYTNKELYEYLNIYYNKLLFIIERYNKKEYIIKYTDFK